MPCAGRIPADDERFAVCFDARLEPQCQRGRAAGLAHGVAEMRIIGAAFELRLDDERLGAVAHVVGGDRRVERALVGAEQQVEAAQDRGLARVVGAHEHEMPAYLNVQVGHTGVVADRD